MPKFMMMHERLHQVPPPITFKCHELQRGCHMITEEQTHQCIQHTQVLHNTKQVFHYTVAGGIKVLLKSKRLSTSRPICKYKPNLSHLPAHELQTSEV